MFGIENYSSIKNNSKNKNLPIRVYFLFKKGLLNCILSENRQGIIFNWNVKPKIHRKNSIQKQALEINKDILRNAVKFTSLCT